MSESESEKRETLADIVAEMREEGHTGDSSCLEWIGAKMHYYADRIEAAWKREMTEAEANALAVGGLVEAERQRVVVSKTETTTVGNAAAMRETLEAINRINTGGLKRLLVELVEADIFDGGLINKTISAVEKARRALSAPARNCDKMPDIDNLTMHDLANTPCKSTLEYASREELLALVRWLLAPAAERKGEGDGR